MTNFWTHLWVVIQCSLAVPQQACKSAQHDFEVACNHTTGHQCLLVVGHNVYMFVCAMCTGWGRHLCLLILRLQIVNCNFCCIQVATVWLFMCPIDVLIWLGQWQTSVCENFYLVELCARFLFYVQQIASCYSDQWNTVSMFGAFTWTRPLFLASRQPCIGMGYAWMRSFKCVCASYSFSV